MAQDRTEISRRMDRASRGDDTAFAELAGWVQDDLFRFGLAHGLRRADAAEATQEALMRAYRQRHRWRRGSDAMAWLYGITMNVVREFRRKGRQDAAGGLDPDLLSDASRGADDAGAQAEALRHLAEAVASLPPRQREAVTCRYLRQMSVAETAAAMGCAEGTVKASVSAALRNLRSAIQGRAGRRHGEDGLEE